MARGAAAIEAAWFSRLGRPLDGNDELQAAGYLRSLGMRPAPGIVRAADWREAQAIMSSPQSGVPWWDLEDAERRRLMREAGARLGADMLLDALTAAVDAHAQATYAGALASGGDEALARAASGAAMTAVHQRALALLAGCGDDHAFVQKYALFESGRFPLGMRESTFIVF